MSEIDDPEVIISELARYRDIFVDMLAGTNRVTYDPAVRRLMGNLYRFGAPISVFPFYLQFADAVRSGLIATDQAVRVLETVESFLVRRAVCGIEPTGLHAVFKRLWADTSPNCTATTVAAAIRRHATVAWPSDSEFQTAVETRAAYQTAAAAYFVLEYDRSLGGEQPLNIPWMEHVLPQNPSDGWDDFVPEDRKKYVDTFANLIPLSRELNQGLGNAAYTIKHPHYRDDAMFKSAREFAGNYTEWTLQQLIDRSNKLSSWAVGRWRD